jgi:triacylglycerol lipase
MSLNLVEIHDTWLPLAAAAYYKFQKPPLAAPALPAGWELVSLIQPGDFGYFARSGTLLVGAFRGTETEAEWLEDFDFLDVQSALGPQWGRVHKGMQDAYLPLRPSIQAMTLMLGGLTDIVLLGHSLGHALACQCAAEWAQYEPRVVTFEGPRVGQHSFAAPFDQHVPNCLRVVNHLDPVPDAPPPPLYVHVGSALNINGPFSLDVHYLHSLERCRLGLEKLIAQSS